jgi:protein-L-isoaspartate(D-aspartate) O-methyltransferase
MSLDFERARFNMVEQQVRPWDVLDARVLDVLREVRREDFVPARYRKLAFADVAIPLEHGEVMMKPVVEGRLLQALTVAPEDAVLEIGTGSGFLTACLARLGREVVSVDIHGDMVERARVRLVEQMGIANVRLETGDAIVEWQPNRQFDVIAVTGATHQIPSRFRDWLAPHGRLFAIRGDSPAQQAVVVARVGETEFSETIQFETDLPYLIHAAPPKRFTL